MIKTDVLVVGAGAAGAALGYLLKKAGKDVLLLEIQDAQKKDKLCAGGLETRAETAFAAVFGETVDEAGLAPMRLEGMHARYEGHDLYKTLSRRTSNVRIGPPPEPKGIGTSIRNLFLSGGKTLARLALRHAVGLHPEEGFSFRTLPRKRLDDYILDRCLSAGGKLLDHCTVRAVDEERGIAHCVNLVTKETFDIEFQTIVGADGAASIVRSLLSGQRQKTVLLMESSVPLIMKEAIVRLEKDLNGYCWYFPRGEDATVGCCYEYLGVKAGDVCRERLAAFCGELGLSMPSRLRGALLPVGDILLRAGKNAYLIGDAAGFIDVFTGGGIHYALLSAKALADALTGGEPYETAMRPQVDFVKKNAKNVSFFYGAARSLIQTVGKPIEPRN